MALFSLLLHFPCSVVSKFLFTILNFYTYKSTLLPQALISIFKIEFRAVTAVGTGPCARRTRAHKHFWERALQIALLIKVGLDSVQEDL